MRTPVRTLRAAAERVRALYDRTASRWSQSLGGDLAREVKRDRVTGLSAEVAFFLVLSLFPALLLVASAVGFLGSVFGEDVAVRARMSVVRTLQRVLTDEAQDTVAAVRALFERRDAGLLTLGAIGGVWSTSRGFAAVMRALDVAYGVETDRGWVARRAVAILLALGTVTVATVMLAMLVVGPLLGAGTSVADVLGLGDVFATAWDWARIPFVVVVLLLWATTVLHFAPNHRTLWRSDLPGGVTTAVWWLVASFGFRYGLAATAGANQVFGALGGALILLVWIYVLALGLLVGGELNAVLVHRRSAQETGEPARTSPAGTGG